MKKKQRKIICFAILIIPAFLTMFVEVIADLATWLVESSIKMSERVKTKLRVYDDDPD